VISYGVYVYHMFAPRIVGAGLRAAEAPQQLQSGLSLLLLSGAATLAVACLSWFCIERPMLEWRRRPQPSATLQASLSSRPET